MRAVPASRATASPRTAGRHADTTELPTRRRDRLRPYRAATDQSRLKSRLRAARIPDPRSLRKPSPDWNAFHPCCVSLARDIELCERNPGIEMLNTALHQTRSDDSTLVDAFCARFQKRCGAAQSATLLSELEVWLSASPRTPPCPLSGPAFRTATGTAPVHAGRLRPVSISNARLTACLANCTATGDRSAIRSAIFITSGSN